MLTLVSVISIAALTQLGRNVEGFFNQANDTLDALVKAHGHCGHKACK